MSKEITKAIILQEIGDKFGLREFEPSPFLFSETVIPTYDLNDHLRRATVRKATVSVTATGAITALYVPDNERWYLHGYNAIFMTGAYTIAGVMAYHPLAINWIYLDLTAAQNTSYAVVLPKDHILEPLDSMAINVDGYTSTGDFQLRAAVTVEELR